MAPGRKTDRNSFGTLTLEMVQLPPLTALEGVPRVTRILATLGRKAIEGDADGDMNWLAAGFGSLTDEDLRWFTAHLAACTSVVLAPEMSSGETREIKVPLRVDEHWAGDLTGMVRWIVWGCTFNWAPFFKDALTGRIGPARSEKGSASGS